MAVNLPQGSIEFLKVDVTDLMAQVPGASFIDDLAGTNASYDIFEPDGTPVVANGTAATDGMTALCLANTTPTGPTGAEWPMQNDYRLYVEFDTPPERPRLGPYRFNVTQGA
jgi:hypothetical protein